MLSWFLIILCILLFFLLIGKSSFFKVKGVPLSWMYFAFFAKILCAGLLLWLYTSYYPNRENADIFKYYDDGKVIASVFDKNPVEFFKLLTGIETTNSETVEILSSTKYWDKSPSLSGINDNRLIIRFNALVSLISFDNVFMHMLIAAFMAFIGLTYLIKSFLLLISQKTMFIFVVVYFSPSLFFWTSGVLKEAFMIFGLGGLFYYTISICEHKISLGKLLMMLLFVTILFLSKIYIALLLIPALFSFAWNYSHLDGKAVLRYLTINLLFIGLALNVSTFFGIDILNVLVQKQSEFKCLAEWMNAGSVVYIPDITHQWTSLIRAAPFALFNTFLRPQPFDIMNALSLIAMLEVFAFIVLGGITFIHPRKKAKKSMNLLLFSINLALILGLLIGWTTPVLGAIVRYRVPIMIFLLITLVDFLDLDKIRTFYRPIEKYK